MLLAWISFLSVLTGPLERARATPRPTSIEKGVMDVIQACGIPPAEFVSFVHGTTIVINAITERKGARAALITTEGFRDVLEIGRGNRPDFFNLEYRKPRPFVPRFLRRELPGRISYKGQETKPLDLAPLSGILEDFPAGRGGGHCRLPDQFVRQPGP